VLGIGLGLFSGVNVQAQSGSSPVQPTDLHNVQEIQDLTLSPTGRNVAYTVRHVLESGGDLIDRTRLYVAPTGGRDAPRLLTRSPSDVSHPAWHPDGNQLAFVRPVDGTPQVFVLSLSGGEPYQLTDAPHGATRPRWSPTGDRLLFAGSVPERARQHRTEGPPTARPGRTPQDTVRRVPPDTLLVLRNARTLDPTDTLALGPDGPQLPTDTTRSLRVPEEQTAADRLRTLPADSLRFLPADSLRAVFERLQILPDTTLVPARADTAASPDGDLLQMRRWLAQNRHRTGAQVFSRSDPQSTHSSDSAKTYQHYFLVDVPDDIQGGSPRRPSAKPVTRGDRSYHGAAWMPGGTQIVVSAAPGPDSSHSRKRNLYVVDLQGNETRRLLDIDGYALSTPRVAPDGTTITFRAQNLSDGSYAQAEIGLFALDGRSTPQIITASFDHDVSALRWSPDGWYLYATAPAAGGRPLYRFAPFARDDTTTDQRRTSLADDYDTSRDTFAQTAIEKRTALHRQALADTRTVQAYDVTDSKAVYAAADPQNPSELYTNTVNFSRERRLSSHNAGWATTRTLAPTERLSVQNGDVTVPGRLTKPPDRANSVRYPLVVMPRGGPPGLASSSPVLDWFERHVLAGRGIGVLEVWPRGSTGYGTAVRRRNYQDWGPGPARDVLAITDAVARRPWVDSTQQAIAGRSYGGSLATWLLAHTDRFEVGVAQDGIYDLSTFFGEGMNGTLLPDYFGGFPWMDAAAPPLDPFLHSPSSPVLSVGLLPPIDTTTSPRTALRRSSPMTKAHQIDAPLLLLHGGADHRAGPGQGKSLYRRLRLLGRPVEYVRYSNTGHRIWRSAPPAQRVDRLVRLYEFLARYTKPDVRTAGPQ